MTTSPDTNDTLDAQLDELFYVLNVLVKYVLTEAQMGQLKLRQDDAKQALTKLIADREREARIDELEVLAAVPKQSWEQAIKERYTELNKLRKDGDATEM